MLEATFIFFEIVVIGLFLIAFYTKQEIIWALSAIFSSILMFTSFNIEAETYIYNVTTNIPVYTIQSFSYPYLMGINLIFFGLALAMGIFDMFEKYGRGLPDKEPKIGNGKEV